MTKDPITSIVACNLCTGCGVCAAPFPKPSRWWMTRKMAAARWLRKPHPPSRRQGSRQLDRLDRPADPGRH